MKKTPYAYRHLARILLEAETPLAIHSGESDIFTDALVATDINGLPYIPGSSIAGILRHAVSNEPNIEKLFGYQKGNSGHGSQLIVSDAIMIGKDGLAMDGIQAIDAQDPFYAHFLNMPVRQHVRMTEKGTSADKGKFDGQITFKGARFVFELELVSAENEKEVFEKILHQIRSKEIRVGSGTRKGFGKMNCLSIQEKTLDLGKELDLYLSKSSNLREEWDGFETVHLYTPIETDEWKDFSISLKAEDFFLFGSGLSDDDADMTPVAEDYIIWNDNLPEFKKGTVIPASSIKGALSHRTAFYWNKLNHRFAEDGSGLIADQNEAVAAIFGKAGDGISSEGISKGDIILDDIIIPELDSKLLNHVSIDRFTGGALEGALFTEKATYGDGKIIDLHIMVKKTSLDKSKTIRESFELALEDLRSGMLPLGGGTNRGHGIFTNP